MCRVTFERQQHSDVAFRIGKLHFGRHGLWGIASVVATIAAVLRPESTIRLLSSQICNYFLVSQARTLLPQVPKSTEILPGIVAPHKEAFCRTISVMHYLITRVVMKYILKLTQQLLSPFIKSSSSNNRSVLEWITLFVFLWRWLPLVPSADWHNGNTWIFVVPIFLGISGDLYVYCTFGDIFTTYQLLYGQLLGLGLAFGFTLGFRNYLPMPFVYGGAALTVWCIIQQGIATAHSTGISV
jgi:hypothetical protein